jgi:hypothetical protein
MKPSFLFFVAISSVKCWASGRTINVKLSAPWPSTALAPIQEVAEFMAEESHGGFWKFVGALRGLGAERSAALAGVERVPYNESLYQHMASLATEVAAVFLSPLQLSALRLTLAVRSFAPLVETHRSLADVSAHVCANASFAEASFSPSFGDTWVVFSPSRRVVCDPSRLVAAATAWCGAGASPCTWPTVRDTSTEEAVAEVDHPFEVMTASGQAATPRNASSIGRRHVNADGAPYVQQTRATLYGRLGSALFWEFHDELVRLSTEGIVDRYVLYSSISAFRGCCCHRWRHPASFYGDLIRSFF